MLRKRIHKDGQHEMTIRGALVAAISKTDHTARYLRLNSVRIQ